MRVLLRDVTMPMLALETEQFLPRRKRLRQARPCVSPTCSCLPHVLVPASYDRACLRGLCVARRGGNRRRERTRRGREGTRRGGGTSYRDSHSACSPQLKPMRSNCSSCPADSRPDRRFIRCLPPPRNA